MDEQQPNGEELEGVAVEVLACSFPYDITAKVELTNGVEIVVGDDGLEGDRAETWKRVMRDLRHGLALAVRFGTMELVFDSDAALDEEDKRFAVAAFDALTEEERTITEEDVARAHEEEARRAMRTAAFFGRLGEFTEAQQQHPDENITIGEAAERHKKGREDVRKIVEGDEDPQPPEWAGGS